MVVNFKRVYRLLHHTKGAGASLPTYSPRPTQSYFDTRSQTQETPSCASCCHNFTCFALRRLPEKRRVTPAFAFSVLRCNVMQERRIFRVAGSTDIYKGSAQKLL